MYFVAPYPFFKVKIAYTFLRKKNILIHFHVHIVSLLNQEELNHGVVIQIGETNLLYGRSSCSLYTLMNFSSNR